MKAYMTGGITYGSYMYMWRIDELWPIYTFVPFEVLGFTRTLDRHLSYIGTSGSWAQKYDKLLYVFKKLGELAEALLSRKEGHILS